MSFTQKISYLHILSLGLGALIFSYLAILAVDILNIAGSRNLMTIFDTPLLWNFLFTERGPVELLQWVFLGSFALLSAYLSGKLFERNENSLATFWGLFSIAGMLMLMEDAVNIRNFFLRGNWPLDWQTLNILETFYFILLAALPLYLILKYRAELMETGKTFKLMLLGFFFYGGAAFVSGPADLTPFNYYLATFLYEGTVFLGGEELRVIYENTDAAMNELHGGNYMSITYRFVDFFVEESLEFLGATMLLSSAASHLETIRKD